MCGRGVYVGVSDGSHSKTVEFLGSQLSWFCCIYAYTL